MFLLRLPILHLVMYKIILFFASFLLFAYLYRRYHSPTVVDAIYHSAMVQTLTGTTEPQNKQLKILETIHAIFAYMMIAGFFSIVIHKKRSEDL